MAIVEELLRTEENGAIGFGNHTLDKKAKKEDTEYEVYVGGESIGKMSTGLGGKLILSVELAGAGEVAVKVTEA